MIFSGYQPLQLQREKEFYRAYKHSIASLLNDIQLNVPSRGKTFFSMQERNEKHENKPQEKYYYKYTILLEILWNCYVTLCTRSGCKKQKTEVSASVFLLFFFLRRNQLRDDFLCSLHIRFHGVFGF